jgi:translocation and assembly module TamB
MTTPRVTLKLDGRDIEMNGQGVQRITANADVGVAPDGPVQLTLNASNLIAGTQRFDSLTVRGQGSMPSHQVTIDLKGADLSLDVAAEGSLGDAGAYRGRFNRLNLNANDFGNWRLQKAAAYSIAGGAIDAGPLCITNGGSSQGCLGFQQPESGRFVASLNLERLGFDLLDAFTPDTTSIEGYLTANARFEGSGQQLTGNAKLRVPEGRVEIVLPQASQNLVFAGTELDVKAGASGIDATFQLPIDEAGRIEAEVGLPGFRLGAVDAQPLTGRLRIDLTGLDKFASLAPDVSGVQGRVDGDIALSGNLTKPVVRGSLAARDLALQVPTIGLQIADLNITAQSESASQMRLSGGALVGGGRFELDGSVAGIGGAEPSLKVEFRGDKLKVADSKEYLAIVSLDIEAGFGAGGGAVRGEISVPRARISPRTVPAGAVQPSSDVVLEEKTEKPAVPISIDVLAKLGDAVLLEAFGLRGLLRGQLRVTQNPGRPLLGNGELQVIDGTYRVSLPGLGILASVGKPLIIKKGIVVFANSPLDNPGIILSAQREGGDITAGLRVLGTLRNPKLAFFSESDPNMTQSEITTYLVTGVPPKRGGKSEDQSLSLGTYIAPKLFMEYDSSLGDKSDTIKMRYDLTKSIQVQSETGDAQGVDIFYKFEN